MGANWPDLIPPPINLLSIGSMMNNTSKSYYDDDEFKHDTYTVHFAEGAELYVDVLNEYYDNVIFVEELRLHSGNITRRQFALALRQLATLIEKG